MRSAVRTVRRHIVWTVGIVAILQIVHSVSCCVTCRGSNATLYRALILSDNVVCRSPSLLHRACRVAWLVGYVNRLNQRSGECQAIFAGQNNGHVYSYC